MYKHSKYQVRVRVSVAASYDCIVWCCTHTMCLEVFAICYALHIPSHTYELSPPLRNTCYALHVVLYQI